MPRVLIVSPAGFAPDWEGNRKRVKQMVELFESSGFEVYFLFVKTQADANSEEMAKRLPGRYFEISDKKSNLYRCFFDPVRRISKHIGLYRFCSFPVDAWCSADLISLVKEICHSYRIDALVCEYLFYSRVIDGASCAVSIIDAHDVFADRYKHYIANGQKPSWFSTSRAGEIKALQRASAVIAIQDQDADVFRSYGLENVFTLIYSKEPKVLNNIGGEEAFGSQEPVRLVFVGTLNEFNVNAMKNCLEFILPALRAAEVKFEMIVIGSVCKVFEQSSQAVDIRFLGRVEELDGELEKCDVLLNPLDNGTGLPIKVLDALSSGLNVCATSAGVRGLPLDILWQAIHVCDTIQSWVSAIVKIRDLKQTGSNLKLMAFEDLKVINQQLKEQENHLLNYCRTTIDSPVT